MATPQQARYDAVIDASQERFRDLRRLTQFYHRFAGNVIRVQQDRDVDLVEMSSGLGTITLQFEQEDQDGLVVTLEPYRNDLVFVKKVGFWAELRFQLFRFQTDPEKVQRVNAMQMKTQLGGLFGGGQVHRRVAVSRKGPTTLNQPGVMEIHSAGSRVFVSTRLIWDLSRYLADPATGRFDLPRIRDDLDAVGYGLEKCLEAITSGAR